MNTHRHTRTQRRAWVQAKAAKTKKVKDILEEAGISRATLYTWIEEFKDEGGSTKVEKPKSKRTIAAAEAGDDSGRYEMLKTALAYTDADGAATRKIVQALVRRYTMSIPQACAIAGADPDKFEYKARKPEVDDALVQAELTRVLAEAPERSFEECYAIIRKTYPAWSRKQLRRIYRDERLYQQRRRRNAPRRIPASTPSAISRPGATWHIGVRIRAQQWMLFIIDIEDNTLLNTTSGRGLPNEDDIRALLDKGMAENGRPGRLRIPGVPPFNQRPVRAWAWEAKIALITLSMLKEENLTLQGEMEEVIAAAFV